MPLMPIALTGSSTGRVETPWTRRSRCAGRRAGSGLLDGRGERLLRHPPGPQETREVGALAQLRDPQPDRAGAGLPAPVAVAVAPRRPFGAPPAVGRASGFADLQFHEAP